MTLENIENIIKNKDIVILYIKSENCSVCVELLPKVQEVAKMENIEFIDIQIEEHREVGGKYNVFSAPTIMMFVMGKEVYREGRFLQVNHLTHTIEKYKNLLL
jgi:thioredoxin-like negative regulator of GroEL